jgi:mitogen-activated protein kinase kinase kinase
LYIEEMRKREADLILQKVLDFEVTLDESMSADDQVLRLLAQVDQVESLYPSRRAMIRDKPIYGSLAFEYNLYALHAWVTVSRSLKQQLQILTTWTGSADLDMKGEASRPFIERILKETGVLGTFDKMDVLNDLLGKAKTAMTDNASAFAKMKLPIYTQDVQKLSQFPNNLMEEFLKVRLEYTENLMKPLSGGGPAAVGELLEDLKASLRLAARIKTDTLTLNEPAPGWIISDSLSKTYDDVMMSSLGFYFKLLEWKFKTTTDTSFYKEVEMLEPEYDFLRTEVAAHLEGSDVEIAQQFCRLVEELLKKVTSYCQAQMNVAPGSLMLGDEDKESLATSAPVNPQTNLTKWYKSRVLESVRARSRKLISFTKQMTSVFETASEYLLEDMDGLIKSLQDSGHILVDVTGSGKGVTPHGYLIFVSANLHEKPAQVRKLLKSCFTRRIPEDKSAEEGYALVVAPGRDKHVRWGRGRVMKMNDAMSGRGYQLKPARVRLIADDGELLPSCREQFETDVGTSVVVLRRESKIHVSRVHLAMKGVERALYNLTLTIMGSLKVVRQTIRKTAGGSTPSMSAAHDLIEDWFTFASDYGSKAIKNVGGSTERQALQLRMNRLAIEWLEFIIHDCVSTDKRTFRWSLFALEFAMKITEYVFHWISTNESTGTITFTT